MTLRELRRQHAYAHLDRLCTCSLWYVPTPVAVRTAWRSRLAKRRARKASR